MVGPMKAPIPPCRRPRSLAALGLRHVEALELKEGDEVEVHVAGERAFDVGRDRSRERALARIRALRKSLPADWRFDREDANAR